MGWGASQRGKALRASHLTPPSHRGTGQPPESASHTGEASQEADSATEMSRPPATPQGRKPAGLRAGRLHREAPLSLPRGGAGGLGLCPHSRDEVWTRRQSAERDSAESCSHDTPDRWGDESLPGGGDPGHPPCVHHGPYSPSSPLLLAASPLLSALASEPSSVLFSPVPCLSMCLQDRKSTRLNSSH